MPVIGQDLPVRLPRTERAPPLLHTEQTWLPMLAERLPLPTPAPVRIGKPSSLFEHTWTIARWVEGEPADRAPITRIEAAETLAGFLRALHHQAPVDAPVNPWRGVSLAGLPGVDSWFEVIADHADADAARDMWDSAVAASAWQGRVLGRSRDRSLRRLAARGQADLEPAGYATLDRVLAAS
jgi:aminoglycoside phosphotransferase (APT) family kinase protein